MKERVLVVKLGALGDIFLALESFQSIRGHHPGAHLVLLTRRPFVELGRMMPWFDEVWTDTAPKFWQLRASFSFARRLRTTGFTRVYDLQGNDRASFYRFLGGWRKSASWIPATMTEKTVRIAGLSPLPVAQRHREMLTAAKVTSTGPADLSWLTATVDALQLPPRFVLLIPGCAPSRPEKRWPAGRYAELGRGLLAQGLTPVLVGTATEAPIITAIVAAVPEAVNLCGRTSIPQLAAVARRAENVVGNDTGPVHIAAMVGTPTLVLMSGQSDPVRMKPLGVAVDCLQVANLAELPVPEVLAAMRLRANERK